MRPEPGTGAPCWRWSWIGNPHPPQILSNAGIKGWLKFRPSLEYSLGRRLMEEHGWLLGVDVVRTRALEHVAMRAAETLPLTRVEGGAERRWSSRG